MFVDASAIVAILTRESEADNLADTLEKARTPITSPIAIFEATLGVCRKRHASVEEAEQDVGEFLELAGVRIEPITDKEARTALAAFSRYGKGRGHPAQLNLGVITLKSGRAARFVGAALLQFAVRLHRSARRKAVQIILIPSAWRQLS